MHSPPKLFINMKVAVGLAKILKLLCSVYIFILLHMHCSKTWRFVPAQITLHCMPPPLGLIVMMVNASPLSFRCAVLTHRYYRHSALLILIVATEKWTGMEGVIASQHPSATYLLYPWGQTYFVCFYPAYWAWDALRHTCVKWLLPVDFWWFCVFVKVSDDTEKSLTCTAKCLSTL